MQNKVIERIWFEIRNMPGKSWDYDGMVGRGEHESNGDVCKEDGDWVLLEDVLSIIERHLTMQADAKAQRNSAA